MENEKSAITINFFKTPEFNFQLLRAIGLNYQGGATIGECLATASRIKVQKVDFHCQVSNMALMNGYIFGWLDEVLN